MTEVGSICCHQSSLLKHVHSALWTLFFLVSVIDYVFDIFLIFDFDVISATR